MNDPTVTVVVPSYNQGHFLDAALASIFTQTIPVEVYVMDGGSTDNSVDVIKKWSHRLAGWQSQADNGQGAAINAGIKLGKAPYVCWLNSDDIFLDCGLENLVASLENSKAPVAYGQCWHIDENGHRVIRYLTLPFSRWALANYCFIAQPSTLIKREVWESLGGLNETLEFAMDFDLWWKCYLYAGDFVYVRTFCAANRLHKDTKTHNNIESHYAESMQIVAKHHGGIPIKWRLGLPIMKVVRRIAALRYR
jgi:glycosyltransferase involved in cell wall biosynthesis